jgi:uncharacterized protein (DUF1330 family)
MEHILSRNAPALLRIGLIAGWCAASLAMAQVSHAQPSDSRAYVLVERIQTTGSESTQDEYARLARDILPKYGGRYLARSRNNALLEGTGPLSCCFALLEFPNMDAVKRWYDSPENRAAAAIRQRGATFRIVAIEGLSPSK